MIKRIKIYLLFIFSVTQLYGQTVELNFPHFADKEWSWTAHRGKNIDTLAVGRLNSEGKAKLVLPDEYKNYRGMTPWLLTEGGGLVMIISGQENFLVTCTEEQPSSDNIIYTNTSENNYLNGRYKRQQEILGKIDVMRLASEAYKNDKDLLVTFDNELQKQLGAYSRLQTETANNPLYAARFSQIVDVTLGLPQSLSIDRAEIDKQLMDFILNQMVIEVLYTSGHWESIWDQWLSWYTYDNQKNLSQLIPDAKHLLSRTKSEEVYAALAEQIIVACEKQNWHNQEIELAFYLLNENRIKEPTGRVEALYTLLRLRKGSKAPDLVQGALPEKKTILAFYDSGCGSCTVQMNKLAKKYVDFKKKGYVIVSVSADNDKTMFEKYAATLPWSDKYCDFEGFAGKDFRNYGVIGTPTFYVLDEKGIVCGRYGRVEDIELQ